MRACVESVFRITRAGDFEIVIVDNGSVEPATAAYYAELAASGRRVRVIEASGPFNFSLLCNKGAAAAPDADALVFLNNDTEALTPDWLDLLAERAMAPDIGAVGAKLFFPDGGVQHIDLDIYSVRCCMNTDIDIKINTSTNSHHSISIEPL